MVKKLSELKFQKIGEIKLEKDKFFIVPSIQKMENSQSIFSIVCENEIKYIGRTDQTLYDGFKQVISNQVSRPTYRRVGIGMRKNIKSGKKIFFYAQIKEGWTRKELDVKKKNYIGEFKPEWNLRK